MHITSKFETKQNVYLNLIFRKIKFEFNWSMKLN